MAAKDWDSKTFHPEKLSKTATTFLRSIYIAEVFGREEIIDSKYLEKGRYSEEASLDLLTKVDGKLYLKNQKRLENEFLTGEPDVATEDKVIDIKTCWDIWTFSAKDRCGKDYMWQLLGYMALTGKKRAEVVYTLVDTPVWLVARAVGKQSYLANLEEGSEAQIELEEQIEKNMTYGDIDPKLRVKRFDVEHSEERVERLQQRIEAARDHLNKLESI